jgi:hypothetical protein
LSFPAFPNTTPGFVIITVFLTPELPPDVVELLDDLLDDVIATLPCDDYQRAVPLKYGE